jgi:hypothetical protein
MIKTGSSSIQASLSAASGNGFVYPELGGVSFKDKNETQSKRNHSDALVNLFSSKSETYAAKRNRLGKGYFASGGDEEVLRKAAADAGDGFVVLSSEALYSHWKDDDVLAFRRFADELFDHITVVSYIREPFSLASAKFNTRVIKAARLAKFQPAYTHYTLLKKFDAAFDRDNVCLWKYDRESFPNRDIVQHFCASLGLPPVPSLSQKNITLSRPAVSAIYRLNRAVGKDADELDAHKTARVAIRRGFPHQDFPKFRLSPSLIAPLVAENAGDMEWIETRLGCSLGEPPEPQPHDVTSEADLLQIDGDALAQLAAIAESLPASAKSLLDKALGEDS